MSQTPAALPYNLDDPDAPHLPTSDPPNTTTENLSLRGRKIGFACLALLPLGLFVWLVCYGAREIADHDTTPALIVVVFGGVLFAGFGACVLAYLTRQEEVMKPLREKVGAVWLVALFYIIVSSILETDLNSDTKTILGGLISVQAMLGVTQGFLAFLRCSSAVSRLGNALKAWEDRLYVPPERRWEVRLAGRVRRWRLQRKVGNAFWFSGIEFAEAKRRHNPGS